MNIELMFTGLGVQSSESISFVFASLLFKITEIKDIFNKMCVFYFKVDIYKHFKAQKVCIYCS